MGVGGVGGGGGGSDRSSSASDSRGSDRSSGSDRSASSKGASAGRSEDSKDAKSTSGADKAKGTDTADRSESKAEADRRAEADKTVGKTDAPAPAEEAPAPAADAQLSKDLEREMVDAQLSGARGLQEEQAAKDVAAADAVAAEDAAQASKDAQQAAADAAQVTADAVQAEVQAASRSLSATSLESALSAQLDAQLDAQQATAVDPAAVDPAAVDPAAVDPAAVDPAAVDPAVVDPAAVDAVQLEAALDTTAVEMTVDPGLAKAAAEAEAAKIEAERAAMAAFGDLEMHVSIGMEVKALAETDPAAAAAKLGEYAAQSASPEALAELMSASRSAVETIGEVTAAHSVDQRGLVDAVFSDLSGTYETMRANDLSEQATKMAEAFGAGFSNAVDYENAMTAVHEFSGAVSKNVLEGRSPHFAADAILGANAAMGPNPARHTPQMDLVTKSAEAMGRAVDHVALDNRAAIEGYNREMARLGEVITDVNGMIDPAKLDQRVQEMMAARAGELAAANQAAIQTINAVDAGAKVAAQITNVDTLNYGVARAATQLKEASLTPDGQAMLASTVAQQVAGQTTMFDNLAAMSQIGMTGGIKENIFDAFSTGAAAVGTNALAHQDLERYAALGGVVQKNAESFLSGRARRMANEVGGVMQQVGQLTPADTKALLSRVSQAGDRFGSTTTAANLGTLTALSGAPNAVPTLPGQSGQLPAWVGPAATVADRLSVAYQNQPGLSRVLAAANLASGLASFDPKQLGSLKGVVGALSTTNDIVGLWSDLAGNQGVSKFSGVAGRALGGVGSALSLAEAMRKGDPIGIAASGLSLAGAIAGNPYIGLGVGAAQLAHAAYTGIRDHRHRGQLRQEFFDSPVFNTPAEQFAKQNGLAPDILKVAEARAQALGVPVHQAFSDMATILQQREQLFATPQQVAYADFIQPIDHFVMEAAAQSAAAHNTSIQQAYTSLVDAMMTQNRELITQLVPGISPTNLIMDTPGF